MSVLVAGAAAISVGGRLRIITHFRAHFLVLFCDLCFPIDVDDRRSAVAAAAATVRSCHSRATAVARLSLPQPDVRRTLCLCSAHWAWPSRWCVS